MFGQREIEGEREIDTVKTSLEFCTEIWQIKKIIIKLQGRQKNFPKYTLMPALRTAGYD